ncbi:hypothetical protein [Vibrio spartinae]|uniref:Uncharacterized protein n=1 Tax=Vibrio spartinae TaxID=1918945 RepID=A0ABX6R015_9VIBR|nr:hypothetical protein [Vibrio spartinae]QMV14605.1 hypothetical protein Vspart_01864 [Vibrio spartinae]
MKDVFFKCVSDEDSCEYIFQNTAGEEFCLYSDSRGHLTKNITPHFWDSFYFCKKIKIEYKSLDGKNLITKVVSYK